MQAQLTQLETDYGIEWQNFRIDELFEVSRGNISNQKKLISDSKGIAFIAQNDCNNGFVSKVEKQLHRVFQGNSLIIGRQTGVVYYQEHDFITTDGVLVLNAIRNFIKNNCIGLFIASILSKKLGGSFGYTNTVSAMKLNKITIQLPTIRQNGEAQIAFDFMEAFIATLKAERLATLKAYLTVTGLTDTTLTSAEQTALDSLNSVAWGTFKIEALFDVLTTKKKFNALDVKFGGKHRYVARGERNNGIRGYISEDEIYLNEANTISFGQDTATLFYQNEPYFTGDKIKVFRAKTDVKLNRNTAQIFIASLKKAFLGFSWGSSSYNVDILNTTQIQLPITNKGLPDYDTMNLVVSALQKVVIQGVVSSLDARIETTAELVQTP